MALTEKQRLFVEEYLIDLNATQAAIRAGYSPKTAEQTGYQLLHKTLVSNEVAKAMAKRSRRTGINQDRVLMELAKIALVSPENVINPKTGTVKEDADKDDLACIQSVKVKTSSGQNGWTQENEVKLNDKVRALELLGKHLGMWKDKVEVSGLEEEKSKLNDILEQMRGDG